MSVFVLSEIGGLREAFAAAGFDPGSMAWLSDAISGALTVADVQVSLVDCMLIALLISGALTVADVQVSLVDCMLIALLISGALTVADVQVRFADCLGVPLIASDGL